MIQLDSSLFTRGGYYIVYLNYDGNERTSPYNLNYVFSIEDDRESLTVKNNYKKISIGEDLVYNVTLSDENGEAIDGEVNVCIYIEGDFYEAKEPIYNRTVNSGELITVEGSLFKDGSYVIRTVFEGNDTYAISVEEDYFVVSSTKLTSIIINVQDIEYREDERILITLVDSNGNVVDRQVLVDVFFADDEWGEPIFSVNVTSGSYFTISGQSLSPNTGYFVRTVHEGNDEYGYSYNYTNFYVSEATKGIASIEIDAPKTPVGNDVSITVTLYDENNDLMSGDLVVSFYAEDPDKNDIDPFYTTTATSGELCTVNSSKFSGEGIYYVKAFFAGSEDYYSENRIVSFILSDRDPVSMDIETSEIIEGQNFNFTVNIWNQDYESIVTGVTVKIYTKEGFESGGEPLYTANVNAGEMSTTDSISLEAGKKYILYGIFNGSEEYMPVSSYANLNVNPDNRGTLIFKTNEYPSKIFDDNIVLTVYLADSWDDNYSANVEVYLNEESIGHRLIEEEGTAVSIDNLILGQNKIEFKFSGDEYYLPSSKLLNVTYALEPKDITIGVSSTKDEIAIGESTVLSTSCDESIGAVPLDVYVDDVKVATITFGDDYTYTGSVLGNHSIFFGFNGNDDYKAYNTTKTIITVYTNTKINIDAKDIFEGEEAVIIVNLTDLNGNLLDKAFNVTIYKSDVDPFEERNDVNSNVIIPIGSYPVGVYKIEAKFIGDDFYKTSDGAYQFTVKERPVLVNATLNVTVKGNTVYVTVKDLDGNSIKFPKIKAIVNGQNQTVEGDADGNLNFTINTDSSINVSYTDSNNLIASEKLFVFYVEKQKTRKATQIIFKDMVTNAVDSKNEGRVGEYFVWKLVDEDGKPLANTPMQIGFNGVVYDYRNGIVTDENGMAKLQINLGYKGQYTFAICFLGDEDYKASFVVAKITVNTQTGSLTVPNKSYKASAKTKALTAVFKSAKGKLVQGKKVTFTVNGKSYTAKTNAKGVATVKVSLNKKGTYKFTAKFAGDSTYSAIKKTGKLTIK